MANILAIDTSSSVTYVAAQHGADRIAQVVGQGHNSHNEELAALTKELLAKLELDVADLDLIALGTGPGSFTGLRIGYGFAKGVAAGAGIPIVAIDSFEAYALEFLQRDCLCVSLLDARRSELFCAGYRLNAAGFSEIVLPLAIRTVAEVKPVIEDCMSTHSMVTSKFICPEELAVWGQELISPTQVGQSLLKLATLRMQSAQLEISEMEPHYVRSVSAKTMAERGVFLGG